MLGASLLLALSAQVAVPVPFSLVPWTLQPLALLLIGAALGPVRAVAAVAAYLLEGAAGAPVFAHGMGGALVLAGPTAGYLLAFPLTAAITGLSTLPRFSGSRSLRTLVMLAAIGALYAGGWLWLAGPMHLGAAAALAQGVVPFFAADAIKAVLAALVAPTTVSLVDRFSR